MLVILDTTALTSDPLCSSTAWRVLAHGSERLNVRIATTPVTLAEAAANYQRNAGFAVEGLEKWQTKYGRLGFRAIGNTAIKAVRESSEQYLTTLRDRLSALGVQVLDVPAIPHMELVDRAAKRQRPCNQNGDGYRDTLNWLTVLAAADALGDEDVVWVTENTDDFANAEKTAFHPELMRELEERDLLQRLTWEPTLQAVALSIAEQSSSDSEADLRRFYEKLRDATLIGFLTSDVVPSIIGKAVNPRECGLYLGTISAEVYAVGELEDVEVRVRRSVTEDEAIAEFTCSADTSMALIIGTLAGIPEEELPFLSSDGPPWAATVAKKLVFRGILSLGPYEKPISGEIVEVSAKIDDPGVLQWRAWEEQTKRVAKIGDALRGIPPITVPPETLRVFQDVARASEAFKLPLETLRALQDTVRAAQAFRIPPETLRNLSNLQRVMRDIRFPDTWPQSSTDEESRPGKDNGQDDDGESTEQGKQGD